MTGILFDLDGTLLNTLEDLADATNYALRQFGFPERSVGDVRRAIGNGAANQIRRCLPDGIPEETVQQVLAVYKPYYTTHCRNKTCPYSGILPELEKLAERYPVAIVSNKPDSAVKELCAVYFPGHFSLGERTGCPRKPAPDMVFQAMAAVGAERCIYVGDSEVDVLTARNAGVPCLSVLWGFRGRRELEEAGAIHFCETPEKLAETLEEMIHGK